MRRGAKTIVKDYEVQSFVIDDLDFFQLTFVMNKKIDIMDRIKAIDYFDDLAIAIREQLNDNNDKTQIEIPS